VSELRVTVFPVAKMDAAEIEAALNRVTKVIHRPVELREAAPLPRGTEDSGRGQHRAVELLAALAASTRSLGVVRLVGATFEGTPVATPDPDATIFVTDVDLFTANTDAVYGHLSPARKHAVVSVRRLREAFYRRKADPKKQRARLVKEILRAIGKLQGLSDCRDAVCVMSTTQALPDIDRKAERFCGSCWRRLSTGVVRI